MSVQFSRTICESWVAPTERKSVKTAGNGAVPQHTIPKRDWRALPIAMVTGNWSRMSFFMDSVGVWTKHSDICQWDRLKLISRIKQESWNKSNSAFSAGILVDWNPPYKCYSDSSTYISQKNESWNANHIDWGVSLFPPFFLTFFVVKNC